MSLFKPVRILDSQLKSYPIKDGQMIITTDSFKHYLDISDTERIQISEIIRITEQERVNMLAPITHFYYTTDKNQLWEYDGSWKLLTVNLSYEQICLIIGYVPANKIEVDNLSLIVNELKNGIDINGGVDINGGYPDSNELDYGINYDGGHP